MTGPRPGSSLACAALVVAAAATLAGCAGEAPPARAREAKADLSLSSARAKVGEPVDVLVSVEHAKGTEARLPPAEALAGEAAGGPGGAPGAGSAMALGGGLEIVRTGEIRARELEARWRLTERTVTVRAFRTGAYSLGPLEVRLVPKTPAVVAETAGPAGLPAPVLREARTLRTPAAKLEVYSVLADSSTLADLRGEGPPLEIEPDPARWGRTVALVIVAVGMLASAAVALRRTARRREELRLHPPPPPPHETALAELARIRDSGLLEEGRLAEYTDRVSDVLRRYLEDRFALPAPDRTTEEFLDEVARAPVLDRERKRFLADYLAQCDLVKFAAAEPGRRELEELYRSSVTFVEETAGAPAAAAGV